MEDVKALKRIVADIDAVMAATQVATLFLWRDGISAQLRSPAIVSKRTRSSAETNRQTI